MLDTNVVLDCWLFEDPAAMALRRAVETGRLRWVASAEMLGELAHVLARPLSPRWNAQRERLQTTTFPSDLATWVPPANRQAPGLLCSDPDDQKFLDTALQERVRWLVTRDHALLKLRRRAAAQGLAILGPAACAAALGTIESSGLD